MLNIKNREFTVDIEQVIKDLRKELSELGINRFSDIKLSGEWIMVTCPYHKNGNESKPSCGINRNTGFLHCFTCGEKHQLDEVIEDCFNEKPGFGLHWLRDHYDTIAVEKDRNVKIDFTRNKKTEDTIKYVDKSELNKYRYFHPYMFERNLAKDVIRRYDVGFDKEKNAITFPVKDYNGNILFIARRGITSKWFNYPDLAEKPIYGVYELNRDFDGVNKVVICESIINCLTCIGWGIPAIALNGTGSTKQLLELEKLPYRTYILGLDPDNAGNKGSDRIINKLKNKKLLYRLILPEGKDINDLTKEEFDNLEQRRII